MSAKPKKKPARKLPARDKPRSLTRKDAKIDLIKAIELRSKGLTLQDIANHFDCSKPAVHSMFKKHIPYIHAVDEIRKTRANILTAKGIELLLSLTPSEIKRMPPGSRATAFGILYDKERLELEKSTENIAVLTSSLRSVDQELADINRQLGVYG